MADDTNPICPNCKRTSHPHWQRKYEMCLDCANAGVPEQNEKIADLTAEVERLRAENESLRQLAQAITSNKLDGIWAADIHINNRFVNWFDRRRELLATPTEGGK